jgi:alpha-glucosidase
MTGRSSAVNDPFQQLTIYLKEIHLPNREIKIEVRAFDDGLAFRYLFPKSVGDSLLLISEQSAFQISGNPLVHALVLPDYFTSHEGNYLHRAYRDLPTDSLMDMLMLFSFPDSLHGDYRSGFVDYAGMYCKKGIRFMSIFLRCRQSLATP